MVQGGVTSHQGGTLDLEGGHGGGRRRHPGHPACDAGARTASSPGAARGRAADSVARADHAGPPGGIRIHGRVSLLYSGPDGPQCPGSSALRDMQGSDRRATPGQRRPRDGQGRRQSDGTPGSSGAGPGGGSTLGGPGARCSPSGELRPSIKLLRRRSEAAYASHPWVSPGRGCLGRPCTVVTIHG